MCWYKAHKAHDRSKEGVIPLTHVRLIYVSDEEEEPQYVLATPTVYLTTPTIYLAPPIVYLAPPIVYLAPPTVSYINFSSFQCVFIFRVPKRPGFERVYEGMSVHVQWDGL